jgi:cytochrome c1
VAETQEDFQAWVSGQRQAAVEPTADSEAAEGLEVFTTEGCIACHTVQGVEGAEQEVGPDLTHFGSRRVLAGGIFPNTPEELARWLADPPAVKPGSKMPDYNLTDEQIEALVAYLHSLE